MESCRIGTSSLNYGRAEIRHRKGKLRQMPLRDAFESQGGWLFRWHSYLPLVMVAVLIAGLNELAASGHEHTGAGAQPCYAEVAYELLSLVVSF